MLHITRYYNSDGMAIDMYGELENEFETVEVEEMSEDETELYYEWVNA